MRENSRFDRTGLPQKARPVAEAAAETGDEHKNPPPTSASQRVDPTRPHASP